MNRFELSEAINALYSIPSDIPRDQWVKIGMAFHSSGGDLETFSKWSSAAPSYNYKDCASTWKSFKFKRGGISGGTLFFEANKYKSNSYESAKKLIHNEFAGSPQQEVLKSKANEIWNRSLPANINHPYIISKNASDVPLDKLRVLGDSDSLTICGERLAGSLVVPVFRIDGTISSLQFIATPEIAARLKEKGQPTKLNLPGHSMQGWFTVGKILPESAVYICEGVGTAWTSWQATGEPAIACFGAGNMGKVAASLRELYPTSRLVIVPDVGKEKLAIELAMQVNARVVMMPDGYVTNSDVSDLAQKESLAVVSHLLLNAKVPPKPPSRFKLINVKSLLELPPINWRVRGVFPSKGIVAIFGPSGSGKSFIAFDLACAIASGTEWFSLRVDTAPVVYAALEAEGGFSVRASAWEKGKKSSLPQNFQMLLQPFQLTNQKDVQDLCSIVPRGAVLFLDTLNRAAPTADENSSKDMGELLEAAKLMQSLTEGLIVLVHHTGKDSSKGMRGHSSLFAAMDGAIEVTRKSEKREWKVAKSKDGIDGQVYGFKLQRMSLGIDIYGDEITSCFVTFDDATEQLQRIQLPQGGNQKLVYDSIRILFKDGVTGKPGAPPLRPCIPLEAAVIIGASNLTCESHRRNSRARDAISGLVTRGVLGLHDGWLWTAN